MVLQSHIFNSIVMSTIVANTIIIALESSRSFSIKHLTEFKALSLIFTEIYTLEAILKIYAEPRGYWMSRYNRFDFAILVIGYIQEFLTVVGLRVQLTFLRVLRALRALRALRGIAFVRALQVIINAFIKTIKQVVHLLLLLLVIMYIFAISAYHFFGSGETRPPNPYWNSLGKSMLTLFSFVTADGWTNFADSLESNGFGYGVRVFSIIFIFIGNFVFTNLFIGIIVQNLEESQDEEKAYQDQIKRDLFFKKKAFILQREALSKDKSQEGLLGAGHHSKQMGISEILSSILQKLRHDDLFPIGTIMCNPLWLQTYIEILENQTMTMQACQDLHYKIFENLAALAESRMPTTTGTAADGGGGGGHGGGSGGEGDRTRNEALQRPASASGAVGSHQSDKLNEEERITPDVRPDLRRSQSNATWSSGAQTGTPITQGGGQGKDTDLTL
ncbi:Cation channel sperm-associated protein 3 [Chara braunii]|uniref:Cation channel sperm-associated protein 3 n=1 Tax=Chara braunii TaxID=69332 RepID=A0A388KWE1_CHABU|nr:Cation channel sperm-associated protein 3 [Chara braunii]|eukprot:GBG74351.1 Cation channel sperm-associated protein 3 [Chara braunii]